MNFTEELIPESAVRYWRQSEEGAARLLHSYWATFISLSGGSCATSVNVDVYLIALVRGWNPHVLTSVVPADDRGSSKIIIHG